MSDDNVTDYTVFNTDYLPDDIGSQVAADVDDAETGLQRYRLSEVIGDYVRLSDDPQNVVNYGYVRDAIIENGKVSAVVVTRDAGYGTAGYRAYPYMGVMNGYNPTGAYYDMPYTEAEADRVDTFDYDRMRNDWGAS